MRSHSRLLAIPSLIIAGLFVLIGCGAGTASSGGSATTTAAAEANNPAGDIPDNQVYVPYEWPAGGFSLTVPEGWARTEVNGAVIFTDKLNSVRIETAQLAQAPTVGSVRSDELPTIESSVTSYAAGDVTTVTRTPGDAVLTTYTGESDPDPVTGTTVTDSFERYEFWNNGVEVILTLSGPQGADNVDPWKTVTDSLTWQP